MKQLPAFIGEGATDADNIRFVSRTPGAVGNGVITTAIVNVEATPQAMRRVPNGTILHDGTDVYRKRGRDWIQNDSGGTEFLFDESSNSWSDSASTVLSAVASENSVFASLNVLAVDSEGNEFFYENLGLVSGHPRYIGDVLSTTPSRRIDQLENTFAVAIGNNVDEFRLFEIVNSVTAPVPLTGGSDGSEPVSAAYTAPLALLAANDDISIVAAPGYSSFADTTRVAIQDALITHVESRRAYRIAVLDTPRAQTVTDALTVKSRIDSTYAALYHPWIFTANPLSQPDNESIPRKYCYRHPVSSAESMRATTMPRV